MISFQQEEEEEERITMYRLMLWPVLPHIHKIFLFLLIFTISLHVNIIFKYIYKCFELRGAV